jgi:hypothetical protein
MNVCNDIGKRFFQGGLFNTAPIQTNKNLGSGPGPNPPLSRTAGPSQPSYNHFEKKISGQNPPPLTGNGLAVNGSYGHFNKSTISLKGIIYGLLIAYYY